MCVCVCVGKRVCVFLRVCVRVCVRVCDKENMYTKQNIYTKYIRKYLDKVYTQSIFKKIYLRSIYTKQPASIFSMIALKKTSAVSET